MKGPLTKEEICKANDRETRFAKARRFLTATLTGRMCNHTTFEEAKTSCLARKRKERQESISSISQERKVIRSNSEERPVRTKSEQAKADIRRVSSNEDFNKGERKETFKTNFSDEADHSPHRDVNELIYDDCEHEKRRSHERFARPLAPRGRRINPGKKPKTRQFSKIKYKPENTKDNGFHKTAPSGKTENAIKVHEEHEEKPNLDNFLQLHREEKQRTPSPEPILASPTIDLSTLHEQIDCEEPIPSSAVRQITEETETLPSALVASNRLLLSPRNSIIMTHRIYLDPEVPQSNGALKKCKNPVEQRQKELTKQVNGLKRKIKKHEEEFEIKFGYKPSHADKLNDKVVKKLYAELSQVRKDLKQLKEDSTSVNFFESSDQKMERVVKVNLRETVGEIEKQLCLRQTSEKLPFEQMNNEQLLEEKISMQKALLYLESLHGRPSSKEDRDLVRPFYDKYRTLKRLLAKATLSNSSVNELATIHENETMDFVSSPPAQNPETDSERTPYTGTSTDSSDTDTSISENLHSLSREELAVQQSITTEEKKELRRSLKQFELDFEMKSGRKVQKDDRLPMENVYASYKKAKAKLRLLDALLNKQTL